MGIGETAVHLAKLIRQGNVGIGFFGRFDPQVEQGAGAGQLAAATLVLAQLGRKTRKRLLDRCLELLAIGLRLGLEILLSTGQLLQARLVIAVQTKRRHVQPRRVFLPPLLQRLRRFLQPRVEPARAAAAQRTQRPLHQLFALPLDRLAPGIGHFIGRGVAPRKLRGHLLHGAEPIAGLGAEAVDCLLRLRCGLGGQQLRPPIHRLAPILRGVASGRGRRLLRSGAGLAVAHGISPGSPVLARLVVEVAVVRTAACHHSVP